MEFQEVVNKRKMIRSFQKRKIEEVKLDRILRNMFKGPSAGFSQGIEILVLKEQSAKDRFFHQWGPNSEDKREFKWPALTNADVIIIVCSHKKAYIDRYAEPDKGVTNRDDSWWPAPYWDIDAGMAALLGLLTVVDQKLGAVFTGLGVDYVRSEYNIPEEYSPIGCILIGYPEKDDKPSPSLKRGRRKLDTVIHYGSW